MSVATAAPVPRVKRFMNSTAFAVPFLLFAGLCAGFCNGYFGTGGGTVLVLFLTLFGRLRTPARRADGNALFSTCLFVTFPLSLFSFSRYLEIGRADFSALLPNVLSFALPAAFGGLAGAFLLRRLNGGKLRTLFSVLVVVSGFLLLLRP